MGASGCWIVLRGRGTWWTEWGLFRGPGRFYTENEDLIALARKQRGVILDYDTPAPSEGEPTEVWNDRPLRTGPLTRLDLGGNPPAPEPAPEPEPVEPVEVVAAAEVEASASDSSASVVAEFAAKAGLDLPDDAPTPSTPEVAPDVPPPAKPKKASKKKGG